MLVVHHKNYSDSHHTNKIKLKNERTISHTRICILNGGKSTVNIIVYSRIFFHILNSLATCDEASLKFNELERIFMNLMLKCKYTNFITKGSLDQNGSIFSFFCRRLRTFNYIHSLKLSEKCENISH
jgi:hypothetical protein